MDKRAVPFLGFGLIILVFGALIGSALVLGVSYVMRPAWAAQVEPDPNAGLIVFGLDPEGPAAEALVVRGDILLAAEGETLASRFALMEVLEAYEPGDEIELFVLHGDEIRSVKVELAGRGGQPYLGVNVCCGVDDPEGPRMAPSGPGGFPPEVIRGLSGAVLVEIVPGSPADLAGLSEGDTILSVDDTDLEETGDLAAAIAEHFPGEEVVLQVARSGEEPREVLVELGEHPDQAGTPYLGVRYRPGPRIQFFGEGEFPFEELPPGSLPFEFGPFEGLPEGHPPVLPEAGALDGVLILQVVEGTPAEAAGLAPGDLILAIDGEKVSDPTELVERLGNFSPGEKVTLAIRNLGSGSEEEVAVELGEHPDDGLRAYLGIVPGSGMRFERQPDQERFDFEGFLPRILENFPGDGSQFRFDIPELGPCLGGGCEQGDA